MLSIALYLYICRVYVG